MATKKDDNNVDISIEPAGQSFITLDMQVGSSFPVEPELLAEPKKKTTRKKKKSEEDTSVKLSPSDNESSDLPMTASNVPYHETYKETDNILRSAISELGKAASEIGEDLHTIRESKTLRKKYDYISALQSSRATVISTVVSAAREMNNSIKNSHELDLKRAKEMKLSAAEQDDVKSIQDMYNAFVSMPTQQNLTNGSMFNSPLGPMTGDMTMANPNIMGYMPTAMDPDAGYQNYLNNMTPEQMTMMIEENPHINQVVCYDPTTGNATFEIYNSENGQFVQGVPKKSAEMFMQDMQFDFQNMQAHSNNLNETYDIIYTSNGMPLTDSEKGKLNNF